jgi:SAM-dependent methyltransferase
LILTSKQDAQGREIYDYYKGDRDVQEIVERDDGFIEAYPGPRSYLSRYRDWTPHHKTAIGHARGRVLDIGCGGGRHSLYLQGKGYEVLGVDVSPLAIRTSKLRGLKNTRLMSITELGPHLGHFDTILMLGNNFGLFASPSKARLLLRRFLKMTTPEARIIAESRDIYKPPVPAYHRKYQLMNRRRRRMPGQVRIRIRYQEFATPWFDYLLASKSEMKRIVKGTGWAVQKFIESKGPQYIAIIRRERIS